MTDWKTKLNYWNTTEQSNRNGHANEWDVKENWDQEMKSKHTTVNKSFHIAFANTKRAQYETEWQFFFCVVCSFIYHLYLFLYIYTNFFLKFLYAKYRIARGKENLWAKRGKKRQTVQSEEKKYMQFKKATICMAMCTYFYICNAYFISASIVFCILLCCWIIRCFFWNINIHGSSKKNSQIK